MTSTVADQVTQVAIGLAVMLVVGGCAIGGGPSSGPQDEGNEGSSATFARLELTPVEGSGVRGNATFAKATTGTRVELELRGLPEPGETYLAHIHPGSCKDEQRAGSPIGEGANHHDNGHGHGEDADAIGYPLTPLESDARGQGSSTTVLEGIAPDDLFSDGPEYLNVHATGSVDPPQLACSDLGEVR
jgi:hypothetical protein